MAKLGEHHFLILLHCCLGSLHAGQMAVSDATNKTGNYAHATQPYGLPVFVPSRTSILQPGKEEANEALTSSLFLFHLAG